MEKILKSREILSSIKSELETLNQRIGEFSQYNTTDSFIPVDLCASTAMALQRLSAYEESLFEKLSEFSGAPVLGIAQAEKIIEDAEAEQAKKSLLKKFTGIKTSNPRYDGLLEKLSLTAAESNDPNSTERVIAEMLFSDLLNNTKEVVKNEIVENSEYYKLAFAFNRSELYYKLPDNTPDPDGSSPKAYESTDNSDSDEPEPEPAPPEPPPVNYSASESSGEIVTVIDLSKPEAPDEEPSLGLDLSLDLSLDRDNALPDEASLNTENSASEAESQSQTESKPELESETEPQSQAENDPKVTIINETEDDSELEDSEEEEIEISEEIQGIVDEYRDVFGVNPNELTLNIEQTAEANSKLNVTDVLNMLSPKSKIGRIPEKVYYTVLSELLTHGPATEDKLLMLPDLLVLRTSNSVVLNELSKLYNKGIISRLGFDGSVLYYFTQKGLKINNNDKIISNFYCYSTKKHRAPISKRDCRTVYPISNLSVCSAVILSRLIKKYPYYIETGSSDNSVEGLSIKILEKPKESNCIVSFTPDSVLKLENLLDFLTLHIDSFGEFSTLTVGSYTKYQAKAVYEVVKKALKGRISSAKVIFYGYKEDKYFDPDTLEELVDYNAEEEETEASEDTDSETTEPAEASVTSDKADEEEIEAASPPDEEEQLDEKTEAVSPAEEESESEEETALSYDDFQSLEGTDGETEDEYEPDEDNSAEPVINEFTFKTVNRKLHFTKEEVETKTAEMILSDKAYCAVAYLRVVSKYDSSFEPLYKYVSYAYDNPLDSLRYSSSSLLSMIGDFDYEGFTKFLFISASLRNLFYNDCEFDYDIENLTAMLSVDDITEIQTLAREFGRFKKSEHKGIDVYSDYRIKEQLSTEENIKRVSQNAAEHYSNYVLRPFIDNAVKRYEDTVNYIFDREGLLALGLFYVANDDRSNVDYVKDYLYQFIKSGAEISESNLQKRLIDNMIDEAWEDNLSNKRLYHSSALVSGKRIKLYNRIANALRDMIAWVNLVETAAPVKNPLTDGKKQNLIKLIDSAIASCGKRINSSSLMSAASYKCLKDTLQNLRSRLDGSFRHTINRKYFFIDFLKPADVLIPLDEDTFLPILDDYCPDIEALGVIHRLCEHAKKDITDNFESGFNDITECDIASLQIICRYLKDMGLPSEKYDEALERIEEEAENLLSQFKDKNSDFIGELELYQSYGKFDTTDYYIKENIFDQTQDIFNYAQRSKNYGFYVRSIETVKNKIEEDALIQGERIKHQLSEVIETRSSEFDNPENEADDEFNACVEKINHYIDLQNYTAAEDLINRIKNNDISESVINGRLDDLNDFIYEYDRVYFLCNNPSVSLKHANREKIISYIRKTSRAAKDTKGGTGLIDSWITSSPSTDKIVSLLSRLGLNCDVRKLANNYFDCVLNDNDDTNYANITYPHIFAPFGSKAHSPANSFRVACFFGANESSRLIREIDNLSKYDKDTILLVDFAFQHQDRKRLAELIRKRNYGRIYMMIDRVAITYLAAHYQSTTDRGASVLTKLMNICMPYSYYQPYVTKSGNDMPPELFMGRVEELNEIKGKNGVQLLYGGRQLGKSALLKKAKEDINGVRGQVAVYIDIRNQGIEEAATRVSQELAIAGVIDRTQITDNWTSLTSNLRLAIHDKKIPYLLLLIDEGDYFIEDCAKCSYKPLELLKYVIDGGSFKFVIAGLHNVARFDRKSLDDNSVIPHFKSLTIRPFKYQEARELLEYPLASIGIMFNEDDDNTPGLISTILATTNYFPSLIQFYCSKLVESLRNNESEFMNGSEGAPPYLISEDNIKKILADKKFNDEIKEKFNITLAVEQDNYYEIIALLVAFELHESGFANGVTPDKVLELGDEYSIPLIADLTAEKIQAFMDELIELNIFRKSGEKGYTFSRQNFLQIMGSEEEVLDRIEKYTSVGGGK